MMGFQQDFLETARVSAEDAAAMVGLRIEELRQGAEKLSILGAFTNVVEKDLAGVVNVIRSGDSTYVVPNGDQPACVGKAVDLVLDNVMQAVIRTSGPAMANSL
jgi:hypothetical protein